MSNKRNMVHDMIAAPWFVEKVKDDDYAKALYAAMCNMGWQQMDVFPILTDEYWSTSWRTAGGIVADLRGEGDYMSWYCSGNEGTVREDIQADLAKLGWQPYNY
jgi:hypothetical protein